MKSLGEKRALKNSIGSPPDDNYPSEATRQKAICEYLAIGELVLRSRPQFRMAYLLFDTITIKI
jgi:hypothetical protein